MSDEESIDASYNSLNYEDVNKDNEKEEEEENENEEEEEEEQDDENEQEELFDNIFGTLIDDNHPKSKLYLVEPEQLVKIKSWDYNRSIDKKHVDNLYKGQKNYINENLVPYFAGNFIIGKTKSKHYHILDGQHRLEAVKLLLADGINHFMLRVEVIEIDDDEEMVRMFQNINNTKAVSIEDMPESKMIELINMIYTNYKKIFSTSDEPKPPHINRRTLMQKIKEYKFFDRFEVTPIKIFQMIQKLNLNKKKLLDKKYGLRAKYPVDLNSKKRFIKEKAIYDKSLAKGDFVLGIDKTYEWLVELETDIETSCLGKPNH